MTLLPEDFVPGDDDVICGRGKKCYNHIGNERFRQRVVGMLDEYSRAKSKLDKSGVLASVVDQIRAASPEGGFVKQNEDGRWYEVGDFLAREKTSQAFRDALHERYKSSNVAKKKRRQEEQAKASDKFHRFSGGVSGSRLDWLALQQDRGVMALAAGSDPRAYDIFRGSSLDAAARLSRLTDMRERLHKRFGTRPIPVPQRPASAMTMRYPDPLFNEPENNAFPTQLPYGRHSLSVPSSPRHEPEYASSAFGPSDVPFDLSPARQFRRSDLASETESHASSYESEAALHHSMPNIHVNSSWNPLDLDVQRQMHSSAPNLSCEDFAPNDSFSDLEPIPIGEITPRPGPKKSIGSEDFKKPISMTLSPTSPSAAAISRDLIGLLEKLNGSTIKDDNPFDPLPLVNGPSGGNRARRDRKPSPFDDNF